jgi:hypothetical protein
LVQTSSYDAFWGNTGGSRSVVPTLRKIREGWGTLSVDNAGEIKGLDFVLLLQLRDYAEIF